MKLILRVRDTRADLNSQSERGTETKTRRASTKMENYAINYGQSTIDTRFNVACLFDSPYSFSLFLSHSLSSFLSRREQKSGELSLSAESQIFPRRNGSGGALFLNAVRTCFPTARGRVIIKFSYSQQFARCYFASEQISLSQTPCNETAPNPLSLQLLLRRFVTTCVLIANL